MDKNLKKIWKQVPVDYYDQGTKTNLFQWIWHSLKMRVFQNLIEGRNFEKILDIGCASGVMTNKIYEIFPEATIFGVDVYPEVISHAKHKYPKINFKVADAHKLPFNKNFFDLVVCYETIEHVLDPLQVLSEIRRITKPGGLSVITMDSGSFLFRMVWWFWERSKGKVWQNAHLHPFNHKELEKIIKKSGFRIVKKHFSHLGMEVSFILRN